MEKPINDNPKKRGRPATGKDPMVGVRMSENFQTTIRDWANKQADMPSMAEAIRRLVEFGLQASSPAKKSSSGQRARAAEMAGEQIDKLADQAHPDAANRKRRLTEGPSDFREQRVDRPRKK